ncbi:MAG: GIY-YIG nuclease family protein [Melioribacteraceae bacterium]|nr:GIY-YIG nuclease family protein [Melioribacteraceae bacterium]
MQRTIKDNSGVYLLEIYLTRSITVSIKKFRGQNLVKGYYYYTGSAQKNLMQRIERHLRKEKKIHWHIDHLTTNKHASLKNIFMILSASKNEECDLGLKLRTIFGISNSLTGFGNSDCRNCETHLFHAKKRINHNHLLSLYQDIVLLKASSKV